MRCLSLVAVLSVALRAQAAAPGAGALAAAEPAPAAEIDAQVRALAAPPPEVEILFDPLSDPRYKLLSASFELDGEPLPFNLKSPETPLFHGKLDPGPHLLDVKVVYNEAQGSGVFQYADYKLTVLSSVKIDAQKGLRSRVHLVMTKHPGAPQKQRLSVDLRVDSEMLAKIDDSPVPDHAQLAAAAPPVAPAPEATPAPDPARADAPPKTPSKHKARRRLTADAPASNGKNVAAPPLLMAANSLNDAGSAGVPDSGPTVAMTTEPAPLTTAVAPVPIAPQAIEEGDAGRRAIGFALFGAGVGLALLAWFLTRRKP